jgi:hypothetical protein
MMALATTIRSARRRSGVAQPTRAATAKPAGRASSAALSRRPQRGARLPR